MGSAQDRVRSPSKPSGVFRLPSSPLFLGLLPAFSGQARLGDLSNEPSDASTRSDLHELLRPADIQTFIAHRGPEVETRTEVSLLGETEPRVRDLQAAILRQFGPLGLKHLLGVFLAAEDAPTEGPGGFVMDVNRHLDRLGYKRSNIVAGKRYHTTQHLAEARSVVRLLCDLTIVQEIRLGPKRGTSIRIRLLLDEAESESWHDAVANGSNLCERMHHQPRLYLRINPYLYSAALGGPREQQSAYTYQLRQLVRENAHQHPWVLILGAALPIRFSLNGGQPVRETSSDFAAMGGKPSEEADLQRLEQELRYMVEQGYLSAFETERFRYETDIRKWLTAPSGRPPRPELTVKSNVRASAATEEVWQVSPPPFLSELLRNESGPPDSVQPKLDSPVWAPAPPRRAVQPLLPGLESLEQQAPAGELLRLTRERLGLSQGELARTLGYTQAAVSMAESGKRPKMAQKILTAALQLNRQRE